MRKLAIFTAVTALGVIGPVSPGAAYHGDDVADQCGDASPGGGDISALSVISRADPSGRDGVITPWANQGSLIWGKTSAPYALPPTSTAAARPTAPMYWIFVVVLDRYI